MSLSMRTLFHYALCPFSRKVRLALAEKKIHAQLEAEPIWKKRPEFFDLNPTGQVPVLVEDGHIISGSQAIVEYLEEVEPTSGTSLAPNDAKERAEVRRLVDLIDDHFYHQVTQNIVYEKTLKRLCEGAGPDSKNLREGMQNLAPQMEYFAWLLEKRDWLSGTTLTWADLALAGHISCIDYLGHISWEQFPEIKDWYMRLKSRPSFQPLLNDNIPGVTASGHYRLLDF